MVAYIWPIALVIFSNVIYHICSKSTPQDIDPFASLTVTYLVAAIISFILYFFLGKDNNLIHEYSKLNWVPFVFGIVIVGLEAGWIFAYRAGWNVGTGNIVQAAILSGLLVLVGWLLFQEQITWNKAVGIGICLIGLVFINYK
ncbi:MAG: EamA family transporter [Dehalococcoidales bacterium]|nr:EamA family transporter [Dehalococcoidales bacterium]